MKNNKCIALFERFIFLNDPSLTDAIVKEKAENLVLYYKSDLENEFIEEFIIFRHLNLVKPKSSISTILQTMISNKLDKSFLNVCIALRIYLSVFGSSCEAERSFSVLKRVKNYLRSNLRQNKVTDLAILCIESGIVRQMDTEAIIKKFAHAKTRKVNI